MQDKITLRRFDDMHCHLRLNPLLSEVLPYTIKCAGRAIIMPNTEPRAILTGIDVSWYRGEINRIIDKIYDHLFEPLMTIEIRDDTTPITIMNASQAGAVAGKVYPRNPKKKFGITTNSENGLTDFFNPKISETFKAMQDMGMLLLLHGELDLERTLVTKREEVFLPTLLKIAEQFPKLKIVLEHISTKEAVKTVKELPDNVAATITLHHLCLTLNDVIGYGTQPHNACAPIPKDYDDREALIKAVISGNPKFFLGSDSAPHLKEKKECAKGKCGVYSAPVLAQGLVQIFEKVNALDRLQDFTSFFGAKFYGLPLNEGEITLVKKEWSVPEQIDSVVPFLAGNKLQWQLA